ncbi:MAG: hypothetical protein ACHQ50_00400 [Fimbriimonadales bacterium]
MPEREAKALAAHLNGTWPSGTPVSGFSREELEKCTQQIFDFFQLHYPADHDILECGLEHNRPSRWTFEAREDTSE